MDITPIKTKQDHLRALKEIENLMTASRNSPEGDRLDVLVTLVEAWETKHYPLDLPDPVAASTTPSSQRAHAAAWPTPAITLWIRCASKRPIGIGATTSPTRTRRWKRA